MTIAADDFDVVYGEGSFDKVQNSKVLVVGAGGVGCELVKNLALTGFRAVRIIDLDTIDVSNLNRQFLFRRRHVSHPKAHVAAEQVEAIAPGAAMEPTVGNIKDQTFDRDFFAAFDVVLNALDNIEARRHVNRMCLAAGTPLVESGSTGYNGQCTVIAGPETECYDCTPKPAQKSYAVCTIRSTPDKPVHCIVWAKFLYELLFGPHDESNVLVDLNTERSTSEEVKQPLRVLDGEKPERFAARVGRRVFVEDLEEQISMADLWKKRSPPSTLKTDELAKKFGEVKSLNLLEQRQWSLDESAAVFLDTIQGIVSRRRSEIGSLAFDKDDKDALSFVVAASNLRAAAYGLELQSPFAAKGIAGNIIHAIATTNAMVASLITLEAVRVVLSKREQIPKICKTTFVQKYASTGRRRFLIQPESLQAPNPQCYVCSRGQLSLVIDTRSAKLKEVVGKVVKGRLGVVEPSLNMTNGELHSLIYETGEGLEESEVRMYEENLEKTLADLSIVHGAVVDVEDFSQNFKCTVNVVHSESLSEEEFPEKFKLEGQSTVAKAVEDKKDPGGTSDAPSATEKKRKREEDEDENDLVIVEEETGEAVVAKKAKVRDGEVVNLDDD